MSNEISKPVGNYSLDTLGRELLPVKMTLPDIQKKLNSPINEIKHRTLQSLELQLRMGMLDHLDVDIVVRLLHLLKSREAKSSDHLIRDILCKYCASRIGRESVITSGGMDIIAELENEGANEQEKQSWGVLRSILSEDQYLQIRTNPRDSSGYQFEVDNFESLRNQRLALFAPIEPTTEQQDHLNHFFALLQSTAAIEIFGEFKWICANVGCGIFLQHSKYLKVITFNRIFWYCLKVKIKTWCLLALEWLTCWCMSGITVLMSW